MSVKAKYYKVFGLDESANKAEVRKAYRKIAKELHPDKNPDPKAHQLFLDLTEAYEKIMNDDFPGKTKKRNEKTTEERKKEAEIRLRRQQERKIKEQDSYFQKMTSGKIWTVYTKYAQLAFVLALLLLIDPLLPKHIEQHTITHFSPKYNGLVDGTAISFKTNRNLELFINNPGHSLSTTHPRIWIERSWIFHNPVKVHQQINLTHTGYNVDFSVISLFPSVSVLFCIPLATYFYRRKNHWFTLMYLFSFYLIGACVVYFLFSQERWVHLLTFGFL